MPLTVWEKKPIRHASPPTSAELAEVISSLRAGAAAVELLARGGVQLGAEYHRTGLTGSEPRMFARRAIADRLYAVAGRLAPRYGLWLFDVFRSKRAQAALFDRVRGELRGRHPEWDETRLKTETAKFVADPYQPDRRDPLPHNTGGAVDLTLSENGAPIDMGTGFDEPVAASATLFFEQRYPSDAAFSRERWEKVCVRRRVLFHAMREAGFVNYADEWWHYDLGNGMWARACDVPLVYDSLEPEVDRLRAGSP